MNRGVGESAGEIDRQRSSVVVRYREHATGHRAINDCVRESASACRPCRN